MAKPKRFTVAELDAAYQAGREAKDAGKDLWDNPHKNDITKPPNTQPYWKWANGYEERTKERNGQSRSAKKAVSPNTSG